LAAVLTFVSAAEYGPVQFAHVDVALTANVYSAHGTRPVTTSVVAFEPVLIAVLVLVLLTSTV
jgi:hypothetical protein